MHGVQRIDFLPLAENDGKHVHENRQQSCLHEPTLPVLCVCVFKEIIGGEEGSAADICHTPQNGTQHGMGW